MPDKKTNEHIRWLLAELPGLREKNILPEDSVKALEEYYSTFAAGGKNRAAQLVPIILYGLSALLASLGIALIIGHNWDQLPASFRLVMGFLPLVPAAVLLYAALLRNKGMRWSEPGFLFLIVGCGTATAVTAQIYKLGGSARDFLFVWCMQLIPLFFLRRDSFVLPVSAWILFLSLAGVINHEQDLSHFLLLLYVILPAGTMIRLMRREPGSLLAGWFAWLLPPFCFAFLMMQKVLYTKSSISLSQLCLYLFFGLLFAEGIRRREMTSPFRNPLSFFGFAGLFVLILAGCVRMHERELPDLFSSDDAASAAILLLCTLLCGVRLGFLAWKQKQWLFAMPFVFGLLPLLRIPSGYIVTILGLICAAEGIRIACRTRSLTALNAGALLICGLILTWFFHSDCSILMRGIVFVVIGVLAGAANAVFFRRFRRKEVPAHE